MVDIDDYEYNIETRYKGYGTHAMLQWKTEKPKAWGYFYANHYRLGVVMVEVRDPDGYVAAWLTAEGIPFEIKEFTHWLGPLPIPEPPQE